MPMRPSKTFPRAQSLQTVSLRVLLVVALLAAFAASAGAVVFTVTLANGTTFETRERPVVAEWDENTVMLRTDQGNWIGLSKDDVADITSEAESSGFGFQVDSSTLFVGFTPGDITVEGDEGEGAEGGAPPPPPDSSPINYGGESGGYGLDQFLDIPADGTISSQPLTGVAEEQ